MKSYLLLICIIAEVILCSFDSKTDVGCITMSRKGVFFVLDSVNSTYIYCEPVYEDSLFVICREISTGKINNTDSTLLIYASGEVYAMVHCFINKKSKHNRTSVSIEDLYINNTQSITFSGSGYNDSTIECVRGRDSLIYQNSDIGIKDYGSIVNFELPMTVKEMKIDCSITATPPIVIDKDVQMPYRKRFGNVILSIREYKKMKESISMYISYRSARHHHNIEYYWANKDSLGLRGRGGVGMRYFDFIMMTREKRHVLTFKDESYVNPIIPSGL